jgi:hypothetical protein
MAGDGARRRPGHPGHLAVAVVALKAQEGAHHDRLRDEKRQQRDPGESLGAERPEHDGKR